ncbi:hypothetical protein AB3M80_17980 [Arthrospira platensis BEA 1257B]
MCSHCGYVADRDVNVAANIRKRGLAKAGTPELTLGEIGSLGLLV